MSSPSKACSLRIDVRPVGHHECLYELALINTGATTLANLWLHPDSVLPPESFGYDSTHFPHRASVDVGKLAPGQSFIHTWESYGPPGRYVGAKEEFTVTEAVWSKTDAKDEWLLGRVCIWTNNGSPP
jgi:hypothetical protein